MLVGEIILSEFAKRLTLLRESKEMKQKELAEVLNVSPACISQYESGKTMPGHDILSRIAQYFEVSVDFLIANEEVSPKFQLSDAFYKSTTYLDLLTACKRIPDKNKHALLTVIAALQDAQND